MKKILVCICILTLMLNLSACSSYRFEVTENTGRDIMIKAENANIDDFMEFGTLEVYKGEEAVVKSNLSEGQLDVELIKISEDQSIKELPDTDIEPTFLAHARNQDELSYSDEDEKSNYYIKVKVIEKATGIINIYARSINSEEIEDE